MRVRSTDNVSRRDDQAREVLEQASRTMDWSGPGRIDHFGQGAIYAPDGLDLATGLIQSSWFSVDTWPTQPVGILCETTVRLCGAEREQTQGLKVHHIFNCEDAAPSSNWDPRRNQIQVIPGGVFALREDALWLFDLAGDEVYRWAAPHTSFAPVVRTPGVYSPDPLESGILLAPYSIEFLYNFAFGIWSTGETLFVGTDSAIEALVRSPSSGNFARPWSASPLLVSDFGWAGSFRDILVAPNGYVYVLIQTATTFYVYRSSGTFNPSLAVSNPAFDNFTTAAGGSLPQAYVDAEAWSEVSSDPSTQVRPKLRAGPRGEIFLVTGRGIVRFTNPTENLDEWEWWLGIENDTLGIDPKGGTVPEGGHVIDLGFDGDIPGVLWRANPDLGLTDDGVLFLFDRSFRERQWQRHYDGPAIRLTVNKPIYPRSNVVHVGRTVSPIEGQGPSPEILGGTP